MIELQHDHIYFPVVLELMQILGRREDRETLAAQALELLIERGLISAGGIWLSQGEAPFALAQRASAEARPVSRAALLHVLATGEPDYPLLDKGGQPAWREPSYAILPLRVAGEITGALAVFPAAPPSQGQRTALYVIAMHLGLVLAHAQLSQAGPSGVTDRAWEEFLSHAAHELKNPLASIKGYADLMLRRASKDPTDPNRKGLTTIAQQVVRMTTLLDQLSDIARLGANGLAINRRTLDLAGMVGHAVQTYQQATTLHQIAYDDGGKPLQGRFDETRMGQVVDAMLSNAIKFSPEGGTIEVHLSQPTGGEAPAALLSVSDRGVGVPEGEQQRVFERFFRGSNIRGSFAGLGVGLYIAQAIVVLHGGRMWLESAKALGTVCYAALPLG